MGNFSVVRTEFTSTIFNSLERATAVRQLWCKQLQQIFKFFNFHHDLTHPTTLGVTTTWLPKHGIHDTIRHKPSNFISVIGPCQNLHGGKIIFLCKLQPKDAW